MKCAASLTLSAAELPNIFIEVDCEDTLSEGGGEMLVAAAAFDGVVPLVAVCAKLDPKQMKHKQKTAPFTSGGLWWWFMLL